MDQIKEIMSSNETRQTAMHCAYLTISYPLDFARTLMQLGYEPFPPTERTFIFGTPYLSLPNTFQYLKYIKSVDGFFGCYRGLAPRICQSIVSQAVYKRVASRNPFLQEDKQQNENRSSREQLKLSSARSGALIRGSQVAEDFISMAKNTGWEILSVTASTVASQPFYVIAVRTMAQFVGRETKYNTIFESIQTIFQEEGILGFFKGLTPRLVGDVIYISLSASLVYLITSYFQKEMKGSSVEAGTLMISNIVSSSFTYQFTVVSTVMAVNNSGLALGQYPFSTSHDDWYECWKSLAQNKQLKRGSSIIGRYYTGPTVVINGSRRPTGFYFGPQHPPGLKLKEDALKNFYPYVPKPVSN